MSTIVRRIGILGLCAGVLGTGCAGDDDMDATQGAGESSTVDGTESTGATTMDPDDTLDSSTSGNAQTGASDPTTPATSSADESTDDGDHDGSETGSEVDFDEEFMWVADFLRTKCVSCHSTDANGSLVLPSADMSNEEVRLALEDVVASSGLLLVEPFDRQMSQTYLQITNEFGAQFPVEDTDRFGDWIDAGAPYLVR